MYEVMPESDGDLLAIKVRGKLAKSDYARLRPWLDQQLAVHPRPSLLVLMQDFEGWSGAGALVEDLRLDAAHYRDLRRIAMVGDSRWQEWMTWLAKPFTAAEVRYFDRADLTSARAWARGSPVH
ncbi:STAS/SEC14 domain-containing protein [Desertibaculum subflavum]|uniref:STAS/SEC14 domain-containing protein n=1 Tax=Desertibaculum subflavum TaxID=2268458 RepID=UPI000E674FFA